MASRVNTKFVIGLAAGLTVVGGLAIYAAVTTFIRSGEDYVRMGDAAMAEGEYKQASIFYGNAYNHDKSRWDWLQKWTDALESWTPATRSEYTTEFSARYLPVLRAMAHGKRTDIAAHDHYLDMILTRMRRTPYTRSACEFLAGEAEVAMSFFSYAPPDQTDWWRLKRYRGLANARILTNGGSVEAGIEEQTLQDLRDALVADPDDAESLTGMVQIHERNAYEAQLAQRLPEMREHRTKSREVVEAFVEQNPDDPHGAMSLLGVEIEDVRQQTIIDSMQRGIAAQRFDLDRFVPRLDPIVGLIRERGSYTSEEIQRFMALESMVDPDSELARSEALIAEAVERHPDNPVILYSVAEVNKSQNDIEEQLAALQRIRQRPAMPMSLDGFFLFFYQEQATEDMARAYLTQRAQMEDTPANADARAAKLAAAKQARTEFAQLVPETDTRLILLDGLIATAEQRYTDALAKLETYNVQTGSSNIEGLWVEAQVATQLNQLGTAKERLGQMMTIQPGNLSAMVLLGQVELNLSNYEEAEKLFSDALKIDPTNATAQQLLMQARLAQGEVESEDQVVNTLAEVVRVRDGSSDEVGDPRLAMGMLAEAMDQFNADPRVARELIALHLRFGEMDQARAVADRTIGANPDNEGLRSLRRALDANDPTDAFVDLIENNEGSETGKLLLVYAAYEDAGRTEDMSRTLERLIQADPEHPAVMNLRLEKALREGATAEATRIVETAERLNTDNAGGLTFRGRLLGSQDRHEEAINALQQAINRGARDGRVFRMLAVEQLNAGRTNDAIATFRRALEVRPDDLPTIMGYLRTLASTGQTQEALRRAREFEKYGRLSPDFVDLWLKLEAAAGGAAGIRDAIARRERELELNPGARQNRIELARLYVLGKQFAKARPLIDELRAEKDELTLVELDANWFADQVTIDTPSGPRIGVEMARGVYSNYIVSLPADEATPAYVSMARFMLARGRPQVAIDALKEAQQNQDPETRVADKLLAEVYASTDDWESALELYRSVVADGLDDDNRSYQKRVVESLLRLRRHDEAAEAIRPIESMAPTDTTVRLQQAEIAAGQRRYNDAKKLLDQAVSESPNAPLVYIRRAQLNSRDTALASDVLADLEQALRLSPNDWRTLRVRSAFYRKLDRDDDAIKDLKAALAINPGMDEVLFGLISELVDKNRAAEAATVAQAAIEKRLNDPELITRVGSMFVQKGEWDRAAQFFADAWEKSGSIAVADALIDSLLRQEPPKTRRAREVFNDLATRTADAANDPGILALRAIIEYRAGRRQDGEAQMAAAFDKALADPMKVAAWAGDAARMFRDDDRATVLGFLGRMASSRAAGTPAREWLDLFYAQQQLAEPGTVDEGVSRLTGLQESAQVPEVRRLAYRLAGSALYGQSNFEQAADVWRKGLENYPDDWAMLNNLAFLVSEQMGEAAEGLSLAERALGSSPDNPQVLDTKAAILVSMERYDEAQVTLERALRVVRDMDTRISLWIRLARVQLDRGDVADAEDLMEMIRANAEVSRGRMERFESDIEALQAEIDSHQ